MPKITITIGSTAKFTALKNAIAANAGYKGSDKAAFAKSALIRWAQDQYRTYTIREAAEAAGAAVDGEIDIT